MIEKKNFIGNFLETNHILSASNCTMLGYFTCRGDFFKSFNLYSNREREKEKKIMNI